MRINIWLVTVPCAGVVGGQLPLDHASWLGARYKVISTLNYIRRCASDRHRWIVSPDVNRAIRTTSVHENTRPRSTKRRIGGLIRIKLDLSSTDIRSSTHVVVEHDTAAASEGEIVGLVAVCWNVEGIIVKLPPAGPV